MLTKSDPEYTCVNLKDTLRPTMHLQPQEIGELHKVFHVKSRMRQFLNLRDNCHIRTNDNVIYMNNEHYYTIRCSL
jgi:hypothetical protein